MALKKLPGVRVPHRKHTAACPAEPMPLPEQVVIPMSMHIGAPSKPIVRVGEMVQVGQPIAESGGFISVPTHASVAGKVTKIDTLLLSNGRYLPAVTIAASEEQPVWEGVRPPVVTDRESFLAAVRDSGVVGLGGAGFPAAAKLTVKREVDAILINGAECEPYITSDTRTMLDEQELVWEGIGLIRTYIAPREIIIGIEENKPECIAVYREKCRGASGVRVDALPAVYPQGGEKVLIYNTTGRIVPAGGLPIDVGVVVLNCTTVAAIARYIRTGMPLIEKVVTVDGSAVQTPKNVRVPIGTPMQAVFDFCGGFREEPRKVLYGGPMMGIAVDRLTEPVLKNTNALLAFGEREAREPQMTECIHCGRCAAACPLHITPYAIERAFRLEDDGTLEKLSVLNCMECGCCSYVCPAKRRLVQTNKLAKQRVRAWQQKQKEAAEGGGK